MISDSRAGRPRASSREVLAEAACELFLEKGYEATSIADITSRAGVSRSSYFNYFTSKGDLLWSALDERITAMVAQLEADSAPDAGAGVRAAVRAVADDFAPDSLALAMANAEAMGLVEELQRESSIRRFRVARAVADRLRRGGTESLRSEVAGAAYGGAVLAALERWADDGPGRTPLSDVLARALDVISSLEVAASAGAVRQLRVVVRADDFEPALQFYRDALGMPEAESYEADGGARVVILEAGRATVELSNAAQVRFIDRVETDGGTSEPIRLAFEVADSTAMTTRLVDAGAQLEASPRETPWRSLNARLRAPAGIQLTLFQELGDDEAADPLA